MNPRSSADEQDTLKRAVLVNVLHVHPKSLPLAELEQKFGAEAPLDQAIDGLESVGLLQRDGDHISASAGAVEMDRLIGQTI